jgi:crotonobetainyl-CoA:carnitine CoA-transferase CaiB-like acyl-CoA transferase
MTALDRPLEGVRVLEYAQYVAGPLCGLLLADLGADVVKVEPPGGDAYRRVMALGDGWGRFFLPLNRGKRSVVLDLKSWAGRERSDALLRSADVVVHNYPAARATAYGLAWGELHERHPALVVGHVTAYGDEGPLADERAYDLVAQARAGLLTAHASRGDRVPVRAGGTPLADLTAGHLLATGVLAALVRARTTGRGDRVAVSLLAAALAVQVQDLVWLDGEGGGEEARAATGADLAARADEIALGVELNPYYRCYEAADGFLAVACLNTPQRAAFLAIFGLEDPSIETPDLVPEEREALERKRVLTAEIACRVGSASVSSWLRRLGDAGVPCGPVHVRETVDVDVQVRAAGLVGEVDQPGLGPVRLLGPVVRVGGRSRRQLAPAPEVGADTAAVLREAGIG